MVTQSRLEKQGKREKKMEVKWAACIREIGLVGEF
jgi:hypothetical protein